MHRKPRITKAQLAYEIQSNFDIWLGRIPQVLGRDSACVENPGTPPVNKKKAR